MATARFRKPAPSEQEILSRIQVRLLAPDNRAERAEFRRLIERHHYLKSDAMVGEQLRYAVEADGQ